MSEKTRIIWMATPMIEPICFRLPKPKERDHFFGCSRTFWNEKILPTKRNGYAPQIKSFVVESFQGAQWGVRLIDFASAKSWFIEQAKKDEQPKEAA